MMSERIYYKKETGYLCMRFPHDLPFEEGDPYIEVDEEEANATFDCPSDKRWAIIDGALTLVDDPESPYIETDEERRIRLIREDKAYLASTDYVIIKISEALSSGDEISVASLKAEYADILATRIEKRNEINEAESGQ